MFFLHRDVVDRLIERNHQERDELRHGLLAFGGRREAVMVCSVSEAHGEMRCLDCPDHGIRALAACLGFQSEKQRQNFMIARARFSNGPNRQMPRCTAFNRLGEPCKAARMRDRSTCFRHSGGAAAKRARLAAVYLSGDLDRIMRAEMRSERNRLRALWRRDPREPGRTIMLVPGDEAACRAWAARQGFQLDLLDRELPAVSDACRWIWARMSRGLISDDDLTAKLARLRNRITEASFALDHSG